MASSRAAELARYDAAERLTYAAIVGNRDEAAEALREQSRADGVTASIDPGVRETIVENDPISAAAAGWLTFVDEEQADEYDGSGYTATTPIDYAPTTAPGWDNPLHQHGWE